MEMREAEGGVGVGTGGLTETVLLIIKETDQEALGFALYITDLNESFALRKVQI